MTKKFFGIYDNFLKIDDNSFDSNCKNRNNHYYKNPNNYYGFNSVSFKKISSGVSVDIARNF